MWVVVGVLAGVVIGAWVAYFLMKSRGASEQAMRGAFAELSQQALQANAEQVVRLAKEVLIAQAGAARAELEGDKKLIDQNLRLMSQRLAELQSVVQKADKDREGSHRALAAQLQAAVTETARLRQTTDELHRALAGSQHRGQWGERMAEDVLRLAGFIEGVNYQKQQQAAGSTRPDFTFPLPNGLRLNMDVKFPLANYLRYLDAKSDAERAQFGRAFIADVKSRIREAATRDYINPEDNTVDYALVFIPNEQVYASIHELDSSVIDEALGRKIVLCSPLTLYAVLAIIRQAAENVRMERRAFEMASLINAFAKQWEAFKDEFKKLGGHLDTARKTYDGLSTTRIRQLEKPLEKIGELRSAGELTGSGEQKPDAQ